MTDTIVDIDGCILMHGDCLERMSEIAAGSVDLVLTDPPYGVTACDWDVIIPFAPWWEGMHSVIKKNGAMVIFSQMPFLVDLINSNRREFRYEWIYRKRSVVGYLNSHKMPMKAHENIAVFYQKRPIYNPQMTSGAPYHICAKGVGGEAYGGVKPDGVKINSGYRYPYDVIDMSNRGKEYYTGDHHPTQKPIALCEYFIRTYSDAGETVADPCMGSGSTGVAAIECGRRFIGIEKDDHWFEVAVRRCTQAAQKKKEELFAEGCA